MSEQKTVIALHYRTQQKIACDFTAVGVPTAANISDIASASVTVDVAACESPVASVIILTLFLRCYYY